MKLAVAPCGSSEKNCWRLRRCLDISVSLCWPSSGEWRRSAQTDQNIETPSQPSTVLVRTTTWCYRKLHLIIWRHHGKIGNVGKTDNFFFESRCGVIPPGWGTICDGVNCYIRKCTIYYPWLWLLINIVVISYWRWRDWFHSNLKKNCECALIIKENRWYIYGCNNWHRHKSCPNLVEWPIIHQTMNLWKFQLISLYH